MSQTKTLSLLAALLSATRVAAHGHVTNVVVNGVSYAGFDINSYPYMSDPPKVAAWTTPNTGNGFIAPSAYNSPDIICHQKLPTRRPISKLPLVIAFNSNGLPGQNLITDPLLICSHLAASRVRPSTKPH